MYSTISGSQKERSFRTIVETAVKCNNHYNETGLEIYHAIIF